MFGGNIQEHNQLLYLLAFVPDSKADIHRILSVSTSRVQIQRRLAKLVKVADISRYIIAAQGPDERLLTAAQRAAQAMEQIATWDITNDYTAYAFPGVSLNKFFNVRGGGYFWIITLVDPVDFPRLHRELDKLY